MITSVNVCIILIFIILTYIYLFFHVIIKERHPRTYHPDEVLSEQVPEEHGVMNNGEQINDHIEEDDHTDNIVEDDGTDKLIHDTFNVIVDDDNDDHENHEFDDDLFLRRHTNPFMKDPKQIFSLLYC